LGRGLYLIEAKTLKSVPLSAPYFKNFINDRIKLKRRAIKEGWTATKLEAAVRLSYEARVGLQRGQRLDKATIFKMLRQYEADWRNTAPPDETDKWTSPSSKKSHHGNEINHNRLLRQKREYNSRPEVRAKRAEYRRKHRPEILEAERKRRAFLRTQGAKKND
jgi:hypothetical protein